MANQLISKIKIPPIQINVKKTENAPIRIDVLVEQFINTNENKPRRKHGRPIDSKDKILEKGNE